MLGLNIEIKNLNLISTLNRLTNEHGVDTISIGNVIGLLWKTLKGNL